MIWCSAFDMPVPRRFPPLRSSQQDGDKPNGQNEGDEQ
jgi:hypothetical protein